MDSKARYCCIHFLFQEPVQVNYGRVFPHGFMLLLVCICECKVENQEVVELSALIA